jgi:hypothetical protein
MDTARPLRILPIAALAAALTAGCAAEVYPPTVAGYTTVYATSVPPDMTAYPRVAYDGSYATLVGDSWYYPYGHRWVVLQREPPELYRYRTTYYYRNAPPAYRTAAPPAYRPMPPRQYAPPPQYGYPPPAVRVR